TEQLPVVVVPATAEVRADESRYHPVPSAVGRRLREGLKVWRRRIGRSLLTAPCAAPFLRERRARQSGNHGGGDRKACKSHVSVSLPSSEGLSAACDLCARSLPKAGRSSESCQLWRVGTVTGASGQARQNPGRRLKENVHPRAAS